MKKSQICFAAGLATLLFTAAASATIFSSVHGLIHDPQHRPVQGARATLRSTSSDWVQSATSDNAGEFHFDNSLAIGNWQDGGSEEGAGLWV